MLQSLSLSTQLLLAREKVKEKAKADLDALKQEIEILRKEIECLKQVNSRLASDNVALKRSEREARRHALLALGSISEVLKCEASRAESGPSEAVGTGDAVRAEPETLDVGELSDLERLASILSLEGMEPILKLDCH
jgi:hypothetical protein